MKKTLNLRIKQIATATLLFCLVFSQTSLAADDPAPQTPESAPSALSGGTDIDLGSNNASSTQTSLVQTIIAGQQAGPQPDPAAIGAPLVSEGSSNAEPTGAPATIPDAGMDSDPAPGTASSTSLSLQQASSTPETGSGLTADPVIGSTSTASSTIEIINTNDVTVINEADADAVTGENQIQSEAGGEDAAIDTGDINVYANVLNVLNTNLVNSEIIRMVENFNNLSADLLLNHPEATREELAQDLAGQICPEVACQSLSSFTLTNQNTAAVGNDVSVSGNSGHNSIENAEENAAIKTGDVKAVVNILNIVNANLVNSRWTIATVNVFGDFTGDLVLPSELYFQDYLTIGANTSAADLADIKKVVIDVNNDNEATVINNVSTDAQTGGNAIASDGDASGGQGDLSGSEIRTGDAQSGSVVENILNTNVYNGKWYLGIINTLGDWSGNIYSLPDQVAVSNNPHGMTFFSTSANSPQALEMFEETMSEAQTLEETLIDINNQNDALIVNNVQVTADTGNNQISSEDTENAAIATGNAYALANILNFANTNLINSDLQVGLVNIFGKWNGNLVFGYPDLAVSQKLLSDKFPKERNASSVFEVAYSNPGPSSMLSSTLLWQFDPAVSSLSFVSPSLPYSQPADGTLAFELGKLAPNSSGKLEITLTNAKELLQGAKLTTLARIYGLGPERNKTNNESLLEVFAAATNTGSGSGQPGQGQSGGGSGSGGSLVRIYKTNDAAWEPVPPGSAVNFTLTIDNDSSGNIYSALIYDVLRDPAGNIISSKKFSLGGMAPMEEAVIEYDIYVPVSAMPGEYTNTAYVEALDGQMRKITSENTAISKFTIAGHAQALGSGGSQKGLLKVPEPAGTKLPQVSLGQVKGEKTIREQDFSPLEAMAGIAEASQNNNPPEPFSLKDQGSLKSPLSGYLNLLLLVFLVALGYAGANLLARLKKPSLHAAEITDIALPSLMALPIKRKRGRPKNSASTKKQA